MIYLFEDCKSENSSYIRKKGGVLTKRAVYQIMALNLKKVINNGGRLVDMMSPFSTIFLDSIIRATTLSKKVVLKT